MTYISTFLIDSFGPFGPLLGVGILGMFLILAALPALLKKPSDPIARLKNTSGQQATAKGGLRVAGRNNKLEKYAGFLEPQNEKSFSAIRLKLMQAGYRHKDAVRYFHFAQFALALGFLLAGVLYFMFYKAGSAVSAQQMLIYVLGPGGAGYYLPQYWVTKRRQERQQAITDGFPDALDMLLVCIESGQSLDQAIVRISRELRAAYPALSDEFELVAYEIKAGKDKPNVLRDMAERCGVPDISSFVTVLIQAATFGTTVADALRVYAEEMRDKRVMRAEEKANKLPTKMTLVTMGLTVPPLLIILVGPSIIGITTLNQ